jgi:hypothetical protein
MTTPQRISFYFNHRGVIAREGGRPSNHGLVLGSRFRGE